MGTVAVAPLSRVPTIQNKHNQRNNNHEGNKSEPWITTRCPIAPATRWNIAGVIHRSFFKLT